MLCEHRKIVKVWPFYNIMHERIKHKSYKCGTVITDNTISAFRDFSGQKLRIWSYLLKKSLMENFIFVQCSNLNSKTVYYFDHALSVTTAKFLKYGHFTTLCMKGLNINLTNVERLSLTTLSALSGTFPVRNWGFGHTYWRNP